MKIRNKIMFLSTVTSAMVVAMITFVTSSCSHGSSGHDYYVGGEVGNYSLDITKPIEENPEYDGNLDNDDTRSYDEEFNSVEEAVEYLKTLTSTENTVNVRVKDKSEADRRALADALRSLGEEVKVYLDLHYTYVDAGSYAFANCKSLEGIVLAAHQEELGGGSFSECENLKEVHCPENLKTIGDRAFYDCESLETVYLPDTLEYIGDWAFYWCESLTTLTKDGNNKLPKSLKSIGYDAFEDCSSLETIDLSETQLKEIPVFAFWGSSSLATVYLPETLEYIGNNAFYLCRSLTTLTKDGNNKLPKSLKSIGRGAFYYCTSLATLIIEKESGKAWGHANTCYKEESNPSAETLKMIPCFEENTLYFLAGNGELQCGTSCCQGGDETCCGEEDTTCACAELTNDTNTVDTCGYSYYWYKVAYPE